MNNAAHENANRLERASRTLKLDRKHVKCDYCQKLSPEQRLVLVVRLGLDLGGAIENLPPEEHPDGMSNSEVARRLGKSASTTSATYDRAIRSLRASIGD
jgi:DNA-directed RNA polymerase specialized sigma24 family protein